jgi:methionyl aminopeptidase
VQLTSILLLFRLDLAGRKKKKKKPKKKKPEQSDPPRIALSKFYLDGIYPEGEIQPYNNECVLAVVSA